MRVLVLLAWMALITYWSAQPHLPIDQPQVAAFFHEFQHRLAHLCAFGLMGLLGRWAFDGWPRAWLLGILATSIFGMTDELHQSFVPGRRAAIDDWALDTASAALAIFAVTRLRATRLAPHLRAVAPLVVVLAFALGVGLAARPVASAALGELGLHRFGS